jgi:putative ABC transport system ATP-binding protein
MLRFMAMPVLTYDAVRVTADDGVELLHGVDAEIGRSRLTVLVGASGSGKSTLLRLANRLEVPSSGRVLLDGEDASGLDPLALRRRVGMVFQRPTPFAGTVRDNLRVADHEATEAGMAEALGRVGLDAELLDRVADDLSGGEAQRMCLARTLLTGPEVVLMDEVTSGLDPVSRREVEALARRLVDDGFTVVWVTHDLAQAARLADDLVVLVDGRRATGAERERFLAGDDEGPPGSPPPEGEPGGPA